MKKTAFITMLIAATGILQVECLQAQTPTTASTPSASLTPPKASSTGTTGAVQAPALPRTQRMPCSSAPHRQFDFWIGDWDVFSPDGKPAGTNVIKPILGLCVLHESWKAPSGYEGESFNTYDASRKLWHQTWVDIGGTLLVMEGRYENDVMTLSDKDSPGKKDPSSINEIQWTKLVDGEVRQLWRASADGGKTWKIVFDGKYVRSVRAQP
ncbi:MAG: hypothetical protein WCL29_04080 [Pseudomonadota bacterium]